MRFVLAFLLLTSISSAQETIEIVLWNAKDLFNTSVVNGRTGDLEEFGAAYSGADIIVLDEVTSLDVVNATRDKMGFTGFHTACSDFNQNDGEGSLSLEVGIVSRFPLANVVEFDMTPDNTGAPGEPAEEQLQRVDLEGIADDVHVQRGFLTCDIPSLGLTIVGTHLKSSGGGVEIDNAKKREFVAAAMAKFIASKLKANRAATVLLAGDLNVGETDMKKNGHRLTEDKMNRSEGDLYDDTHAILSNGLVDGLHMASLTKSLGTETYDSDRFRGSGPIDCMYVVGAQTSDFMLAKKSSSTFGSDHFAVRTLFHFSGEVPFDPDAPDPETSVVGVTISSLLPNPAGEDPGHEWVELKNNGTDPVNLTGWKLVDESNHVKALTGSIAAGSTLRINLAAGELPLNNGGDEITLFNAAGEIVSIRSYTGSQAAPGQVITF